jgi:ATP-dependent protease ClpP protease subunit
MANKVRHRRVSAAIEPIPSNAVFFTPRSVTEESTRVFIEELVRWHQDLSNKGMPVLIDFVCNGGNIEDGVAIKNTIELLRAWGHKVFGRISSRAWSCAVWILQSCDVRIVGNGATLLIHEPSSNFSGDLTHLKRHLKETEAIFKRTLRLLLCKANIDEKYVRRRVAGCNWIIEGPEAVELGFADWCEPTEVASVA